MTSGLLVKKFIKNSENTKDPKVRSAYGTLTGVTGIICNTALFAGKFFTGLFINSVSVMADAFNNLSDAASSVIGLAGMKIAGKPADKGHPFGHGRMEYIASLIVSFIVIIVGLSFLKNSIEKIMEPEEMAFSLVSLSILLASVLVKLWLSFFNRRLGKKIDSQVMAATATDALGDVLTTSATIFSLLFFYFTGINIDGYVGLLVSIVVIWAGIKIIRNSFNSLMGEPTDPELYNEVLDFINSHEQVLGCHDLIIHNYGPSKNLASAHVEVSSDLTLNEAHNIADHIERETQSRFDLNLVIHTDPVDIKDERRKILMEEVTNAVKELDSRLSVHDFRIVSEGEDKILFFDVLVPFSYSEEELISLHHQILEKISALDSSYQCVVTLDNSYVAQA